MQFDDDDILSKLERASATDKDSADFGIIELDVEGKVTGYNPFESRLSGLSPERVLGHHFFTAVAPCTNNFMVAQRFEDEAELDAVIDYVFTLKMKPTKVKLRLLRSARTARRYLLVRRS